MLRMRASEAVPQLATLVAACPRNTAISSTTRRPFGLRFLRESLVLSCDRLDDADFAQFCDSAIWPQAIESKLALMAPINVLARVAAL